MVEQREECREEIGECKGERKERRCGEGVRRGKRCVENSEWRDVREQRG